uniref:Leucine-rich repeat-containing N-terminal plant-type domain-containing protein n=1 Tax=Vitis vinifera TaxID=29760 RepID=F6HAB4_VITVI
MDCLEVEKEALLKFKQGLTDPSGRLSSWVGEDCCKRRGVSCYNRTGCVIKLKLGNPFPNSLEGDGTVSELGGIIPLAESNGSSQIALGNSHHWWCKSSMRTHGKVS